MSEIDRLRKQISDNAIGASGVLAKQAEELGALRWVVKGAHGALTDAGSVVVPGTLEGDLAPAIRQLVGERDALRQRVEELERDAMSSAPPYYRKWEEAYKRAEAAEANAALLDQAATDYRKSRDTAEAKLARCVEALEKVERACFTEYRQHELRRGHGEVLRIIRAALAAARGE